MWNSSSIKDRILIGKHGLDCGGDQIAARYRDSWSGRYDGVHMYGTHGKDAYTRSVLDIMKAALPIISLFLPPDSVPGSTEEEEDKKSEK